MNKNEITRSETPRPVLLKEYAPPAWLVDDVELDVRLHEDHALVRARLSVRRNPQSPPSPLVLDGEALDLLSVAADGRTLAAAEYELRTDRLVIDGLPDVCMLETAVRLRPQDNLELSGLYRSGAAWCTQCEAEGFRRITYYPDRPDVMARFTTRIEADRSLCPVLLSNGNRAGGGELPGGRHFAVWQDPFPKPCYLFALVAGRFDVVRDTFATASGRDVALEIYVEPGHADKAGHAMASLKRAMRWDEEKFGREYDLDIFMLVAVADFNMGAMENKGLNIFNAKYVLARPDTATDADYENIEGVVGHEYFHNWTGNRITCRDWFQLSLKEGLTVYRDQEFSSDMGARAVKRIEDVNLLRSAQFREDAGPMSHPVRPDSYVEINNFYTLTVYEKGAEVVRMLRTFLGEAGFRRGMDLYFARHDGQAVTCDDFLAAMADANRFDLKHFPLWYEQAGTPRLEVRGDWDAAAGAFTLTVRQSCPPTPGQPVKKPLRMPLAVGLLGADGREILPQDGVEGELLRVDGQTLVLDLGETEQTFCFRGLAQRPVPSLLRGFSAPVRLEYPFTDEDLTFLWGHDPDPFSRWEAGQQLMSRVLRARAAAPAGMAAALPAPFIDAFARTLAHPDLEPAFKALALALPSETWLAEQMEVIEPRVLHAARESVAGDLANALADTLQVAMGQLRAVAGEWAAARHAGRRALRNHLLGLLASARPDAARALCRDMLSAADNMTDAAAALTVLIRTGDEAAHAALSEFYGQWQHEALVIDKWFAIQAACPSGDALARVRALMAHPAFTLHNPNRARSLLGAFAFQNMPGFHRPDGAAYQFLADCILEIDSFNPQVAARLATAFANWRRLAVPYRNGMQVALERLCAQSGLSRDVFEIVNKTLGDR